MIEIIDFTIDGGKSIYFVLILPFIFITTWAVVFVINEIIQRLKRSYIFGSNFFVKRKPTLKGFLKETANELQQLIDIFLHVMIITGLLVLFFTISPESSEEIIKIFTPFCKEIFPLHIISTTINHGTSVDISLFIFGAYLIVMITRYFSVTLEKEIGEHIFNAVILLGAFGFTMNSLILIKHSLNGDPTFILPTTEHIPLSLEILIYSLVQIIASIFLFFIPIILLEITFSYLATHNKISKHGSITNLLDTISSNIVHKIIGRHAIYNEASNILEVSINTLQDQRHNISQPTIFGIGGSMEYLFKDEINELNENLPLTRFSNNIRTLLNMNVNIKYLCYVNNKNLGNIFKRILDGVQVRHIEDEELGKHTRLIASNISGKY